MKSVLHLWTAAALVLALPGLSACAPSQTGAGSDPVNGAAARSIPAPPPRQGPALWRVADADTTIYMMGTVHVLPGGLSWYDEAVASAFDGADTIVTEVPMGPEDDAKLAQVAQTAATLPEGTTLRSLLDPQQRARFEAALASLDLPAQAFDRVEPWMASLSLSLIPIIRGGYDPASGTEKVLIGMAPDKRREALETIEFQIAMFDTLPMDRQIAMLMENVEGLDETKAGLDAMVAEWLEGDAEGLGELLNEAMEDAETAETLLYARNARWADWIVERLDTQPGTVFMAVGAGHLAGERSVQDMLAARGVQVIRVR